MSKLLLLALLGLGLSSCATRVTPRNTIRHYRRVQRQHERQRRHETQPNLTWSKL